MSRDRKLAYLALLTTSIIWGFAPPIIKIALSYTSVISFLFYRFLIVSLILIIPLLIRIKKIRPSRKDSLKYLVLGLLGTPLTLFTLFMGLQRTTAIDGAILSIISPILVIVGGAYLLKENVTARERTGIIITLVGAVVTIIQPLFSTGVGFGQSIIGNLLVLTGTIFWAAFTLLSKKYSKLDPMILTASSFILGTLIMLPLLFTQNNISLPTPAIFGVAYMAILGSVVAYSTYIWGLSKIEASEASVFTYLQPIIAVPAAAILLGEQITVGFVIGALLIGIGVYVAGKDGVKHSV